MLSLAIFSLKIILLGQNTILKPVPAGQSVDGGGKVTAAPDPDCDPTQNMCEMWLPGNYSVVLGEKRLITCMHNIYHISHSLLSLSFINISCLQWPMW